MRRFLMSFLTKPTLKRKMLRTKPVYDAVPRSVSRNPLQSYSYSKNKCKPIPVCNTYVLTAAHCVSGSPNISVIVGDHDITTDKDSNSVVKHDVRQIIIHPQNDKERKNDLALIRLVKPIQYNENVGPVCLPWNLLNLDLNAKTVILAGWGTTEYGGPISKRLRKVDVVVTSCSDNAKLDQQKMLCTYGVEKDSCQVRLITGIPSGIGLGIHFLFFQYDSGGCVYYKYPVNNRIYCIAVIQGGRGCASKNGINTRIVPYLKWISENVVGCQFCTL